jgi:soluble lytic murein transglycosylase-like protein
MKKLDKTMFIRNSKEFLDELHAMPIHPPALIHLKPAPAGDWYDRLHLANLESIYNLPQGILKHMIDIESGGDPLAHSNKGAKGLFQIMDKKHSGFTGDPFNPIEAAKYAAKTLNDLAHHFGNYKEAVAAYDWGIGNMTTHGLENAPEETKNYIKKFEQHGTNLGNVMHSVNDVHTFERKHKI